MALIISLCNHLGINMYMIIYIYTYHMYIYICNYMYIKHRTFFEGIHNDDKPDKPQNGDSLLLRIFMDFQSNVVNP